MSHTTRRGSVYLIVLVSSALVVAMVLTGLMAERSLRRRAEIDADAATARSLANSAVDLGLQMIAADANWRTNLASSGQWLTNASLGGGQVSLLATDPVDGNFTSGTDHGLLLQGTATIGQARQMVQVELAATFALMPCAQGGLHCSGSMSFNPSSNVTSPLTFSTNAGITATSATIATPVEAGTTILGSTYSKGTRAAAGSRSIPASTVADQYVALATPITFSSIPSATLRKVVLSPASNPFGTANPQGIYFIDCGFSNITIRDLRIVGTLILKNPGNTSTITGSVNWEPAFPGNPALLITGGGMILNLSATALSESSLATNFNPPSTPYRGFSDTMTFGLFPSQIRGLVYCTGNTQFQGTTNLQGVFIGGSTVTVASSAVINISPDPVLSATPPKGFRTGPTMTVVPGTWKRVVDP